MEPRLVSRGNQQAELGLQEFFKLQWSRS